MLCIEFIKCFPLSWTQITPTCAQPRRCQLEEFLIFDASMKFFAGHSLMVSFASLTVDKGLWIFLSVICQCKHLVALVMFLLQSSLGSFDSDFLCPQSHTSCSISSLFIRVKAEKFSIDILNARSMSRPRNHEHECPPRGSRSLLPTKRNSKNSNNREQTISEPLYSLKRKRRHIQDECRRMPDEKHGGLR